MKFDHTNLEKLISNNHNIVVVSKNEIQNVISILKSVKRVYLLIISDEPLISNREWSVVMQQKFKSNYFVLIKKVR